MIATLSGILKEKLPPQVLVEVNGVGYEVDVPMTTFYALPAPGEKVTLFTHLLVREDAHLLYGFASRAERQSFRELIKISGIGARTALAILSGLTADELAAAIASEDIKRLSAIPGIGKKTAERLVLELRGKVGQALPLFGGAGEVASTGATQIQQDILNALQALGYNDKEARGAVKSLAADVDVSDGIRQALKSLSRA